LANNKVQLADGSVLIDLTNDTVTANTLKAGYTAHDASGNIITGTMPSANSVPSYWKSAIADKAATIRGRDGYQFCYFTDVHWEDNNKQSPVLIRQLMIDTGANCCVCGGDLIVQQDSKAEAIALLTQVRDAYGDLNVAYCVGNHDLNSSESSDTSVFLTEAEWRGIFDTAHTGVTYYTHTNNDVTAFGYRDHPESKIREIFINTGVDKTASNNKHFSTSLIWACNKIKELSAEWGVIVFCHKYWQPTGHMVKETIGTTVKNYIAQYVGNRQAELIAIITGHAHDDYYEYDETAGYLIASVTTDSGEAQTTISETDKTRTPGTTLEQAFDVITVDRTNKTLYFDRVGAGSSRALPYYYMPMLSITYNLTDVTSSSAVTTVNSGDSYTTTLTPTSGKEMSSVVITMGGVDITSTVYNSSTGVVSIASVTGAVVITASASATKPVWTNLVPTSLSTTGAVYNGIGYKNGKYLSNTTATLEGGNDANFTLTGRIPYSQADFAAGKIICISGLNWTTDDHCRFIFLKTLTSANSTPYCKGSTTTSGNAGNIHTYFALTDYGDYWTLTPINGKVTNTALTYIAFSLKGVGADLSIGVIDP
jgi:predicted MPP superfamily phosphohydrolase